MDTHGLESLIASCAWLFVALCILAPYIWYYVGYRIRALRKLLGAAMSIAKQLIEDVCETTTKLQDKRLAKIQRELELLRDQMYKARDTSAAGSIVSALGFISKARSYTTG